MSDYTEALNSRIEAVENALMYIEKADDAFIDPADREHLENAKVELEDLSNNTRSEAKIMEKDWELIVDHCDEILSLLRGAARQMDEDGLIVFDTETFEVEQTITDEPDAIKRTRIFLDRQIESWSIVRQTCREVATESGGVY